MFLRGTGMGKKQAGGQKEAGKELPGGSAECGDSGRVEIFGETEKPGEVGSAHAHKLFQKLAKRRQCRLILAEIPRRKAVVDAGGLFGKVRCHKAREHRLHAACAKGEHQCVEWCGELVDTKGLRTDPARQEYSIEKSKNSADDPGRGQDQCAKKKRVLFCDFQHGIDSFHGIAQIV